MTTYLTKTEDAKTHHFRVAADNNGVAIVHGVFYNWLGKYSEGCGDPDSAIARQKQIVEEKLNEGYQITTFIEGPENTIDVYDKAKWHYGGDIPEDLDQFQGYVHTGMFLGWLIDNDLVSDEFREDHAEKIKNFKHHQLTGSKIYEEGCDGVLMIEDVSELGNRFALSYFDLDKGEYLNDYEIALAQNLPSLYYVNDTWENYMKLKQIIDKRFEDWKSTGKI